MQQRPVSATVFAILNIVFAVFGLCCLAAALPAVFNPNMVKDNPIMKIIEDNEFYSMFSKFQLAGGLLFNIVLAISGIGLLLLRSWGRTLSICYGAYAILSAISGLVMNVLFLFRPLMDIAESLPEGTQRSFMQGQAVGGLIGGGIALIYPILLLFFMFRPNVIKAYCGHIDDDDGGGSDYLGGDGGASDAQDVKWE